MKSRTITYKGDGNLVQQSCVCKYEQQGHIRYQVTSNTRFDNLVPR